jgi:hypothetical protein
LRAQMQCEGRTGAQRKVSASLRFSIASRPVIMSEESSLISSNHH